MFTEWREDLKEVIVKNSTLFTWLVAMLIIVVGVTIVDNPQRWWFSLLAVFLVSLLVFLFLNGRVILKATASFFLLSLETSYAFKLGTYTDPNGLGSVLWMFLVFTVFFLCLSISYLVPSSYSRWIAVPLSTTIGFFTTYVVAIAGVSLSYSAVIGAITSLVIFFLFYKFGRKNLYRKKILPTATLKEDLLEELRETALNYGWGAVALRKRGRNALLIWNENGVYALSGVELEQRIGVSGKRHPFLSYKGKNINAWLMETVYHFSPLLKTKGVDLVTVLLDLESRNGIEPKTVGVQIPDSKKKIPVGIYPARTLLKRKAYRELLEDIERNYKDFVSIPSERQLYRLDRNLPKESSNTVFRKKIFNKKKSSSDKTIELNNIENDGAFKEKME